MVRVLTKSVRLLTTLLALGGAQSHAAGDWHSVDEIKSAAEQYLSITLGQGDDRVEPTAGHLDSRLQLPRCSEPPEPYLQNPGRRSGRIVVGVRCAGERPWNVYLPVHVAVMDDVLVSADSLPRGQRLEESHLQIERRDVSGLVGGYLTDRSAVVGQRLKRAVGRGVVLKPAQLVPDILIRKGQTVTLMVEGDALNISMSGRALMDGAANERIRVENAASGRIVEGLVQSRQRVLVSLR